MRSLRGPGSSSGSGPRSGTGHATNTAALGSIFGRWDEIVGEAVAAHVQPVKLDGTRLVVDVDDPAWATQLKFLESSLRDRLGEATGAVIETFEIRVKRR